MALTPAQQAYYDALVKQPGQGTPDEVLSYVRGLNDYQSLASLAAVQGRSGELTPGASGYQTMDELESMYQTPVASYGAAEPRQTTLTSPTVAAAPAAAAPATGTSAQELAALYQQYFGRTPDESGAQFWLGSGYTPDQIAAEFAKSPEYLERQAATPVERAQTVAERGAEAQPYAAGAAATPAEINRVYNLALGRDVDLEGLNFYGASGWTPEQIYEQISASPEAQQRQAAAQPGPVAELPQVYGGDTAYAGNTAYTPNMASTQAALGAEARPYAQGVPASATDIYQIYQDVLGRAPDQGGLDFYSASGWSPEQIKAEIQKSVEALAPKPPAPAAPAAGGWGGVGTVPPVDLGYKPTAGTVAPPAPPPVFTPPPPAALNANWPVAPGPAPALQPLFAPSAYKPLATSVAAPATQSKSFNELLALYGLKPPGG